LSETLARIQALVARGSYLVSNHAYDEMLEDAILLEDILASVATAEIVEDYPLANRGPSVLALQRDADGRHIHVLWGIPKGLTEPAVVITAYRPGPALWSSDFLKRRIR
jgi:hypothetical protein